MDCFRMLESLGQRWEGQEARWSGPTSAAARGTSSRLPSACLGTRACRGWDAEPGQGGLGPSREATRHPFHHHIRPIF